MRKHFEKKKEVYQEFENLYVILKNEQDLNSQRKYIESKLMRINKQMNKCFNNFEMQQQHQIVKAQLAERASQQDISGTRTPREPELNVSAITKENNLDASGRSNYETTAGPLRLASPTREKRTNTLMK